MLGSKTEAPLLEPPPPPPSSKADLLPAPPQSCGGGATDRRKEGPLRETLAMGRKVLATLGRHQLSSIPAPVRQRENQRHGRPTTLTQPKPAPRNRPPTVRFRTMRPRLAAKITTLTIPPMSPRRATSSQTLLCTLQAPDRGAAAVHTVLRGLNQQKELCPHQSVGGTQMKHTPAAVPPSATILCGTSHRAARPARRNLHDGSDLSFFTRLSSGPGLGNDIDYSTSCGAADIATDVRTIRGTDECSDPQHTMRRGQLLEGYRCLYMESRLSRTDPPLIEAVGLSRPRNASPLELLAACGHALWATTWGLEVTDPADINLTELEMTPAGLRGWANYWHMVNADGA